MLPSSTVSSDSRIHFTRSFVEQLSQSLQTLFFTKHDSAAVPHSRQTYIPSQFKDCTHVWLRVDRTRQPLEAPYTGPHRLLRFGEKTADIEVCSGRTTVSIDRLKPCVLSSQPPSAHLLKQPPQPVNDMAVWCTCKEPFNSDMIACDNANCPIEWYHFRCVGLTTAPKGRWYCQKCKQKKAPRRVRFQAIEQLSPT